MSTQPSVARAHVSLATAWPPCGSRPTDSGRKPHGSRTASTRSAASRTSEKAPFHAGSVRSMRSSHVRPPAAASISVITSESLVAVSPKPFDSSSSRSACGVDDVAVVGERQRAVHRLDEERLDVALVRRTGRRVAGVADRVVAGQRLHRLVGEDVRHQPGLLVDAGAVPVADGDAGRLLAAVLQGEQPEERQLGDALAVRRRDAEHAALLVGRSSSAGSADGHGDLVGVHACHVHSCRSSSRRAAIRASTG